MIIKKIFVLLILMSLLQSCNTIAGTAKGIARDVKATYIYGRDSISVNPISDKPSK